MNTTSILNLITTTLTSYGTFALGILTAVIGVGVAYLAFKFGWARINDTAVGRMTVDKKGNGRFTGMDADGHFVKNAKIPF